MPASLAASQDINAPPRVLTNWLVWIQGAHSCHFEPILMSIVMNTSRSFCFLYIKGQSLKIEKSSSIKRAWMPFPGFSDHYIEARPLAPCWTYILLTRLENLHHAFRCSAQCSFGLGCADLGFAHWAPGYKRVFYSTRDRTKAFEVWTICPHIYLHEIQSGGSSWGACCRRSEWWYCYQQPGQLRLAVLSSGLYWRTVINARFRYGLCWSVSFTFGIIFSFFVWMLNPDSWVFSSELTSTERTGHQIYDPSRSPTSQIKGGYSWRIRYGDGSSASGDVYTDTVQVGGTTVRDQAIELASTISAQFQRNMNDDGLLGLAFSTINTGKKLSLSFVLKQWSCRLTSTVSPSKQKTFFESAKASLSSPLFTVDLKKGEPGTYTFGTIDSSKYSGQIAYVPVDPSRGFWSFTTAGYAIGEDAPSSSPFRAIADTGTTLLLLPDDVVRSYYNQVPSASYTPSQGGYTFACGEDLPSVTIVIGNYDAVVPGPFIEYAPIDDTATSKF